MSKQTAVQWLVEKLNLKYGNDDFIITHINEIEQAKAMEKENMIQSMGIAFIDALKIQEGKKSLYKDWEHYYNETYGGDK
jgi:hypothetical protein